MISTGHMIVGYIGESQLSPQAKQQVDTLLNYSLNFPEIKSNRYHNLPPELLAKKLVDYLAADWGDAIKVYTWKDAVLQKKYSTLHYLDTRYSINSTYTQEEMKKLVVQTVGDAYQLNVVNAMNSCIKTLCIFAREKNPTTEDWQQAAIALRFFFHLPGDAAQPYHTTDPMYQRPDGKEINTYGGNEIFIAQGRGLDEVPITLFSTDTQQKQDENANEFHLYWDACCNIFEQLPEVYTASFDAFGNIKWFGEKGLGGGFETFYRQYIAETAKVIQSTYELQHDKDKEFSTTYWAQESAWLGYQFLNNNQKMTIKPEGGVLKLVFHDLPQYKEEAKGVIYQQINRAGYYLGNLLNAIFDAEHVPQKFQHFIQSIQIGDIPSLATLVHQSNPAELPANTKRHCKAVHKK